MSVIPPTIIEGREAFAQSALNLIALPRFTLRIMSQQLDRAVYGTPEFIEALKQQLLDNRRLQVQLLLADSRAASRNAEPLRQLAARLSSQFQFRTPVDSEAPVFADEALIADRTAYLHRSDERSLAAKLAHSDAPGAHLLITQFEQLWNDAEAAADFRDMPM